MSGHVNIISSYERASIGQERNNSNSASCMERSLLNANNDVIKETQNLWPDFVMVAAAAAAAVELCEMDTKRCNFATT